MARGYLFDEGDELITRKSDVSGSAAHLSSESVRLTIDGVEYNAYPLDKTYKDLLEYPSPIFNGDEETGINVFYPSIFQDGDDYFEGYPFKVTVENFGSAIALYSETETSTLYYIPQE